MSTGWIVGFVIGGVIVLAVVVLLLMMIGGARRAAVKAESILEALEESRDNTEPLWAVHDVNSAIGRITAGAAAVRTHLAARHGPAAGADAGAAS